MAGLKLGYKQKGLIALGERKGFVDSNDLLKFYKLNEGKKVMNCLVMLGYFNRENLSKNGLKIIWRIKR